MAGDRAVDRPGPGALAHRIALILALAAATAVAQPAAACCGVPGPAGLVYHAPVARNNPVNNATVLPRKIARAVDAVPGSALGPSGVIKAFPATMTRRFSNTANAVKIMARLTDRELQDIADDYVTSGGAWSTLYSQWAAANLARASRITPHPKVVTPYSSALVATAAATMAIDGAVAGPISATAAAPIGPQITWLGMSVQEIYLDLRTSPVYGMTAPSAAYVTGVVVAGAVYSSALGGWDVGTWIRNNIILPYAPGLDSAIGAGIANTLNAVAAGLQIIWPNDPVIKDPAGYTIVVTEVPGDDSAPGSTEPPTDQTGCDSGNKCRR